MHLKRCLIILATTCVALTAAIPLTRFDGDVALTRREPDAEFDFDLFSRANTPNQKANAVFKAQGDRTAAKEKKTAANASKFGAITDPKEKGKAIQGAQKAAKDQRREQWDAKAKKPNAAPLPKPGAPKQPGAQKQPVKGPSPGKVAKAQGRAQDKQEAKGELSTAANRMKNTVNIPGRKDSYSVGGTTSSGKDVRKAVMLSHMNENNPTPYGKKGNAYPKTATPHPYPKYAEDAKAKGHFVLPPGGLQEHPVTPKGWQGGNPGNTRVLTSKEGGRDKLNGVVGHADGTKAHFEAQHTPARRELEEFDLEM